MVSALQNGASATPAAQCYAEFKSLMQWPTTLDIPLLSSEDEIVNIDFKQKESLLDNPEDFIQLLIEENCNKSYWLTIAVNYVKVGKIKEGIKLIELSLKEFQGPESAHLHTFLSWAYLDLAKLTTKNSDNTLRETCLKKAEFHLQNSIQFEPIWIGNMLATIDIFYQKGEYDKALETIQLFTKAISSNPNNKASNQVQKNVFFLLMKAKLLYQKGNYLGALKLFQELIILNPLSIPDPRIGCGLCYWQLGDFEMAILSWERSLELDPENFNVKILLLLSKYHTTISDSLNDEQFMQNYTANIKDLHQLYELNKFMLEEQNSRSLEMPEFKHVEETHPVLLILLQMYYYFIEDYKTVIDIYEKKFENKLETQISKKTNSISLFWAGRACFVSNDLKKSLKFFQQSLNLDSKNGLSMFGLGQIQYSDSFLDEAILTFENYNTKIDKHSIEGNYVLGCLMANKYISTLELNSKSKDNVVGEYSQTDNIRTKAIDYLETYIKLVSINKRSQMVSLKAYVILSQLYEQKNMFDKCIFYYQKMLEQLSFLKSEINWDIYNNLGCYYFATEKYSLAKENFELAYKQFPKDKKNSLKVTIEYNLIRTDEELGKENGDVLRKYDDLLIENPNSLVLKLRKAILTKNKQSVEELMNNNKSNLEVRSIYSWMIKLDKSFNVDEEINHNKGTLEEVSDRDLYALITLGNIYINICRKLKRDTHHPNELKLKSSYLKALKLFRNALNLDPHNVYAAQGIAIVYAGLGSHNESLQILRRCRDSISDKCVFINLAQELTEIKDYIKAIDNYNIALSKCTGDVEKADVLNLLGRVWLLRFFKDGSLDFIVKAVESNEKAIKFVAVSQSNEKFAMDLQYNKISLYSILISKIVKLPSIEKSVQQLEQISFEAKKIIEFLESTLKDSKLLHYFNEKDLKNVLLKYREVLSQNLAEAIDEQNQYNLALQKRLDDAKDYAEKQQLLESKEREEEERLQKEINERELAEYAKLQEEAQRLIEERQELVDDEDDKVEVNDDGDDEFNAGEKQVKKKSGKKGMDSGKKRKRAAAIQDDEDAEEDLPIKKGKKSTKSSEFIADSDESEEELVLSDHDDNEEVEEALEEDVQQQ
ncbi:hypothetical protein QEN19_003993 [Hanseniaspora menglaensis]